MVRSSSHGRVEVVLAAALLLHATAQGQALIHHAGGLAANERQGSAVAILGDLDGDGRAEFTVGAPGAAVNRGMARTYSGADGSLLWSITGPTSGSSFGSSLAALGDVDGDGRGDLAVGAPLGNATGAVGCGLVFVVSGATGATLWQLRGDSAGDHMGWSVAALGDIDHDGVPDVLGGAPDDDDHGESTGSARVWSGATGATIRTVVGAVQRELFGYSVGGGADLDGDGTNELVVGGTYFAVTMQPGVVRAHSGATGAVLWSANGVGARDALGSSVACVGDVDGDGRSDVLAGARQPFTGGLGYARLYSGASGALLQSFAAGSLERGFGTSVCAAGDVDYDGVPDFAIGAPDSSTLGAQSGLVRLVSGAASTVLFDYVGVPGSRHGQSVHGGVDISGEGGPDLALGAPSENAAGTLSGAAYAFRGSDVPPPDPHDALEADVAGISYDASGVQVLTLRAGQANAGRDFLMLGSLNGTEPGFFAGAVHVPLVSDRYTKINLLPKFPSPIVPVLGVLDADGMAQVEIQGAKLHGKGFWVGRTIHHAFIVQDAGGTVVFASNAVAVTIVP